MDRSIVVTGIGVVGPLGSEPDRILGALEARAHGIRPSAVHGPVRPLGLVRDFEPDRFVEKKKARRMEPSNIFSLAAAQLALRDAALPEADYGDTGLMMGTGFSGFHSFVKHYERLLKDGIEKLSPIHFPNTVSNASAGMAAIELGLKGPCSTVTGIGTCGEYAIFYAWMLLMRGMAERVLVIGAEGVCEPLVRGFRDMGLLARPEGPLSVPFAASRHGITLGEGGAALLLETEENALRAGRKPYGRFAGFGFRQAPTNPHGYGEDPAPIDGACGDALRAAGLTPRQVDWVSAAANGSAALDALEANALPSLFDPERTRACALKAYTGESASAGVMRIALGLLCASNCMVPAMPDAESEAPEGNFHDTGDVKTDYGAMTPFLTRDPERRERATFLHHAMATGGSSAAMVIETGAW